MNIKLFNKPYWLRRFGKQEVVRGYLTSPFTDYGISIHVHPTGGDTVTALPEGQRRIKRLEGHGEVRLLTANEDENRKGDLLYYMGDWYECVSSQLFDHTILSHYNYQFVEVPLDASNSIDLAPPVGTPPKGGSSL